MKKNALVVVALVVCFLGAIVYSECRRGLLVRPPEGVKYLDEFLAVRPNVQEIQEFLYEGESYVLVTGDVANVLLSLPSGPPVYIFDGGGGLIDWTPDLGDSPSFVKKWGGFEGAVIITVEATKPKVAGVSD